MAVGVQHGPCRLRGGREEQKTALYKDVYMEGLHTSTKRQTGKNLATLGVSLVVLGPFGGP